MTSDSAQIARHTYIHKKKVLENITCPLCQEYTLLISFLLSTFLLFSFINASTDHTNDSSPTDQKHIHFLLKCWFLLLCQLQLLTEDIGEWPQTTNFSLKNDRQLILAHTRFEKLQSGVLDGIVHRTKI